MNKNFDIYKNYSLPPFRHPYSCSDTIESKCYENISLEDCIDKCSNSKLCNAGYYLSSNDKSYCFPLYTERLKENNPSFDMRPKDKFGINGETAVFLNKEIYSYPPNNANGIFFFDILLLKKANSNLYLFTTNSQDDTIKFSEDAKIPLRLIKRYGYDRNVSLNYEDELGLALPGTNLILSQERGIDNINWNSLLSGIIANEAIFTIRSGSRKDQVAYGDTFQLVFKDNMYLSLKNNELVVSDTPTEFQFEPAFNVYYCDKGRCKSIPLKDVEKKGLSAIYNSKIVYRNDYCYDQCLGGKRFILIPLVILVIIIFIIIIFLIRMR